MNLAANGCACGYFTSTVENVIGIGVSLPFCGSPISVLQNPAFGRVIWSNTCRTRQAATPDALVRDQRPLGSAGALKTCDGIIRSFS